MNPNQTVKELYRVATKLNNSKSPDKNLVVNELNQLIHKIAAEYVIKNAPGDLSTVLAINFVDDTYNNNLDIARSILEQIHNKPVWVLNEESWVILSKVDPEMLWFHEVFLLVSVKNGEAFESGEINLKQDDDADRYDPNNWQKFPDFDSFRAQFGH